MSSSQLSLNNPVIAMAGTCSGAGVWLAATDGGIFTYGDAPYLGTTGSIRLNQPIDGGIASTPRRPTATGSSLGRRHVHVRRHPVLRNHRQHSPQPTDRRNGRHADRARLLARRVRRRHLRIRRREVLRSDRRHPTQPTRRRNGRHTERARLLARRSDGGIFAFGDAHFYGATGGIRLNQPIAGMASTPSGNGYTFVARTAACSHSATRSSSVRAWGPET